MNRCNFAFVIIKGGLAIFSKVRPYYLLSVLILVIVIRNKIRKHVVGYFRLKILVNPVLFESKNVPLRNIFKKKFKPMLDFI